MLVNQSKTYQDIADAGFHEILAATAASKEFSKIINNNKRGNFSDFIVLNRQYYTWLHAFTGKNCNKKLVNIPEITGSESLLTERHVRINHLPSNWQEKVFATSYSGQKYIKQYGAIFNKGRISYNVKKNEFFLKLQNNIPHLLEEPLLMNYEPIENDDSLIQNLIMHNYSDNDYINFSKLAKRLNLTNKFGIECDALPNDLSCYASILTGFRLDKVFPLVGTLRKYFAGYTVVHFLCSIDIPNIEKKNNIQTIVPKLDHHIPYLLYENPRLHGCISDSADLDVGNTDGFCRTYKLIVRNKGENKIYVLYVAVFSKDNIIRSKHREDLIIFQYEKFFKKNGFDVYLDRDTKLRDEDSLAYTAFKIKNPFKKSTKKIPGIVSASSILFVAIKDHQAVFASSEDNIQSEYVNNVKEYVSSLSTLR